MSKLRPLGDRVLVQRTVAPDAIRNGIIIPETARETPQEGTVVAVGRGRLVPNSGSFSPVDGKVNFAYEPLQVKPGDRVLFGKYAGSEITIDGQSYVIMREDDLLGEIVVAQAASS